MIKTDILNIDGRELQRTYSDTYLIRQIETGAVYSEAVDVIPCRYTYEETAEILPADDSDPLADAQSALGILGYTEEA